MNARPQIQSFLADLLRRKGDPAEFADNDGLLTSGRLDSVDALDVVVFLEEKYGVNFGDREFDQSDLDSVDNIVELIGSR